MNTKQIPFRYPEDLEKYFKEICESGYWSKLTKNKALIQAVQLTARLKIIAKSYKNPESKYYSKIDAGQLLDKLEEISKKSKENNINDLDLKYDIKSPGETDIKKVGRKK